jgi:chromosomal replication initiator protein
VPPPPSKPELPAIAKAILTLNEGRRIPFPAIVHTVAVVCQVSEPAILGPRRHRETVRARQILWYVCRNIGSFCILSFEELGRRTGGRDHTSVLHGVKAVTNDRRKFEPHLSQVYRRLGVNEIPTRGLGRE